MKLVKHWNVLGVATSLATAFILMTPTTALAQDAADENTRELEEVMVTARKREEALQDVALSVSAMGSQEIDANFATDLRDLVYISPNLVLDDTNQGPGGVAATYIRGIGVSEVEKNFDPAVGVVVDGVFRGTMTGSIVRAIDLERVEVLRGPQGTLFGRNTIGGVINLERSKPTMQTGGKVRGSYGDYETALMDAIINFGNNETWGVKLTGSYRDQGEGYFLNATTGRKDGQSEYKAGGVNLLFAPSEGVEIEWTSLIERTDQDSNQLLNVGQPGQVFCDVYGWCSPNASIPVSGDRYVVGQAFDNYSWPTNQFPTNQTPDPNFDHFGLSPFNSTFDADTHQIEVRWDLNDSYRIDYIGGRWETEEKVITDWDAVQDLLFHTDRPAEYKQDTHELRLTYDSGDALTYTVGAYYWDSSYEIRLRSLIAFFTPFDGFLLDLPQTTNQTNESKALFFEGDYRFNDQWTLTLGGRWTDDEKTTDQFNEGNPFTTTAFAKADWSEFTPKVAVKWDFSDDAMLYGLYSRGYRAGGFNGRVDSVETAITPYDPETVDNYELGYKSRHMNDRLQFNATLFYMDYKDKQEEIQQPSQTSGTGQVTRVVNASNATIQGAELELMYLFENGLTLRTNLGLLDAEYDDFLVNTGTSDDPVFNDFSSLDFRRAPKVTASVSGDYRFDAGRGEVLLHAGARYLSSHEVDFANKPELSNGSSTLVDASISWYVNSWYLSAFGRNLTDDDSYALGFDVAGLWSYAAVRPPRTYGFEVGYSW